MLQSAVYRLQYGLQYRLQATDCRLHATVYSLKATGCHFTTGSTLCSAHYTLYFFLTLQCLHSTLYFAQSTIDFAKCDLPSVHSKVYSAKFSLHNYCRVFTIISPVVAWITDDNYSGTMHTSNSLLSTCERPLADDPMKMEHIWCLTVSLNPRP